MKSFGEESKFLEIVCNINYVDNIFNNNNNDFKKCLILLSVIKTKCNRKYVPMQNINVQIVNNSINLNFSS